MYPSVRQAAFDRRLNVKLGEELSGNGDSGLGYPKGQLEKLLVFRRTYGVSGVLAKRTGIPEMLGTPLSELGSGPMTEAEVVAELNSRNVFSKEDIPAITREQAIIMGVCRSLQYRGRPLIFAERYYVDKIWWDRAVRGSFNYATEKSGTRSVYGVDVWKFRSPRKVSGSIGTYYGEAKYPYKDASLVRAPGTKINAAWYD